MSHLTRSLLALALTVLALQGCTAAAFIAAACNKPIDEVIKIIWSGEEDDCIKHPEWIQ